MRLKNKKGSILITLIVAILIMAVLGLGIYTLFSSSSYSELLSNRNDNAYQLAKTGIRFASDTNGTILGNFQMPDSSHIFNLVRNGNVITSTGIVNAGTFLEARRVLQYTILGVTDPRIPTLPQQNQTVGTTGSIANSGGTITLGGSSSPGVSQSYGAIWYNGNNAGSNCSSGACNFNLGLRAYFEFYFLPNANSGDGFTFAIMSALTNTNNRSGGFSKTQYPGTYTWNNCSGYNCSTSVAGGELMGYAGPGNTDGSANSVASDGQGLRPPKMAVEFDTYDNYNNTPLYLAMTRNDPTCSATNADHLALQFWGDDTTTGYGTVTLKNSSGIYVTLPMSSFDDNVHGTPTATYRQNGLGMVCYALKDAPLSSVRIEITRPTTAVTSGTYAGYYQYLINVWVEQKAALSALQLSHMQDVLVPFTDILTSTTYTKISQYAYFTQTEHNNFANIFWGFTQGTGDEVQQVQITNSDVFFPNTATCSYAISTTPPTSPPSATYTAAGGSGSVTLTTTGACYWAVQSLANWITITSTPSYGIGSTTINYSVAANTGPAQTGYINIAGQTFTVNQASGCTYSFGACPAAFPRAGGTSYISVTTNTGCTWTSSDNASWISTSPTSSSGSGTVTITAATGNSGNTPRSGTVTVSGTMGALQSQTCTITENH